MNAVDLCAAAILGGRVLQAEGVSAGNGIVIDWRAVRSGEATTGDVFDVARVFVALVGDDAAIAALKNENSAGAALPKITAWPIQPNRSRIRGFRFGRFSVSVQADNADEGGDDEHEAFTRGLARVAATGGL